MVEQRTVTLPRAIGAIAPSPRAHTFHALLNRGFAALIIALSVPLIWATRPLDAAAAWTDEPLCTPPITTPSCTPSPASRSCAPVKAAHIMELRAAIDALLPQCGLPAVTWTDNPLITCGPSPSPSCVPTPLKAIHIREIQNAIAAIYASAQFTGPGPAPTFCAVTSGTSVLADHIEQLRFALNTAACSPPPPPPPPPCAPVCGDGVCCASAGEDAGTCPADCSAPCVCGDAVCNAACGETAATCPADCTTCTFNCGDGICASPCEDATNCRADCCTAVCGDGYCCTRAGETAASCPGDCGGCSCTSWTNGACGGGGCAATMREQTRTCTPAACQAESQCVNDAACSGGSGCVCGPWVNGSCGGTCGTPDAMSKTRTCTPSPGGPDNCSVTFQCIPNVCCKTQWQGGCPATPCCSGLTCVSGVCRPPFCGDGVCNGGETLASCPADCTPPCSCTPYVDQGCGAGPCWYNNRYMTRTCNPPGCNMQSYCWGNPPNACPACASSGQRCTGNGDCCGALQCVSGTCQSSCTPVCGSMSSPTCMVSCAGCPAAFPINGGSTTGYVLGDCTSPVPGASVCCAAGPPPCQSNGQGCSGPGQICCSGLSCISSTCQVAGPPPGGCANAGQLCGAIQPGGKPCCGSLSCADTPPIDGIGVCQ